MKRLAPIDINLAPKDPFLSTAMGRFLQWALSVGRYLVIFTELVVVISFATRFNLDRQVTDLNGQIHQRQAIISSYGDLEQQVVTVQKKIDSYTQIEQQTNIADVLPALSEITPPDIQLSQLSIQGDTVTFAGTSPTTNSLSLLINNIQLSSKFTNVNVDKIETADSQSQGFRFAIHAKARVK